MQVFVDFFPLGFSVLRFVCLGSIWDTYLHIGLLTSNVTSKCSSSSGHYSVLHPAFQCLSSVPARALWVLSEFSKSAGSDSQEWVAEPEADRMNQNVPSSSFPQRRWVCFRTHCHIVVCVEVKGRSKHNRTPLVWLLQLPRGFAARLRVPEDHRGGTLSRVWRPLSSRC